MSQRATSQPASPQAAQTDYISRARTRTAHTNCINTEAAQTDSCMHTHNHMRTNVYPRTYTQVAQTHTRINTHAYTQVEHKHSRTHARTQPHIYARTNVRAHTATHIRSAHTQNHTVKRRHMPRTCMHAHAYVCIYEAFVGTCHAHNACIRA